MPFFANTPESSPGLARSDSRNAGTTCRGITTAGQTCKRALPSAGTPPAQPSNRPDLPEELYCWQHKKQANAKQKNSLQPAASIETLIERLKINDRQSSRPHQPRSELHKDPRATVSAHVRNGHKQSRRPGTSAWLCCFVPTNRDDDDQIEIVRHKTRIAKGSQEGSAIRTPQIHATTAPRDFHRLIPRGLPLEVKVQLQRELTKPLSDLDETGYIYMYRKIAISDPNASNLDIGLSNLPQKTTAGSKNRKILIKIGYTSNVQKRLSTWSSKCRSQIELLRYYPYVSSGPPRKTPHCRMVERLVHIELGNLRVKQPCACGTVHREWFEIDASIQAVRSVDRVIQRWICWAES